MGQSAETSDFVVDCLTAWWHEHQKDYPQLEEWVIDLDGGSTTRSNRTQFIKRMVELAQRIGIRIRLIYYPPYHSKYNSIERCWAALENYWNGAILDSVETAL
jgi:Rhodopirellula transposase DDE domain